MVDVNRRIDTAIRQAIWQRNYRRQRDRALTRLSAIHKEQYLQLLEEEKERDEQEGKAWLDITGRTSADGGASTAGSETDKATNRPSNKATPRNLGAEA